MIESSVPSIAEPAPEAPVMPDVVAQCKELVRKLPDTEKAREYARVHRFAQEVEATYPDARQHQLFQWLIGGSPNRMQLDDDSPGQYSIKAFMRRFIADQSSSDTE